MLKQAAVGINPGPAHGDITREFTSNDVPELAARLVAKKKLSKEAAKANADAEAAVNEANLTANRIAQEAVAEEAKLMDEVRQGVERGLAAIDNAQSRDASNANALNGQIGNAPAGNVLTLPAQMDQINVLAPIIRQVAPELAPCGGPTGEQLLGQGEVAKLAVEQERILALKN